jgi:Kef-type K+ transport system membrane component KefB
MSCSVTALPILVLLLEKLHILRHPFGQRVLRFASLDDIAIWAVLALVLMDWQRLGKQAIFLVAFALATVVIRRLLPKLKESDRWFISIIWLVLCGLLADWAGLHYMVGAFLSGAIIDHHWFRREHLDQLREHLLLIAMPVFFLITGLRTQWDLSGATVFAAAALLLAAAIGGKLLGVQIAGRLLHWRKDEAFVVGWLLQTKALILIIFANVLLDRAVISSETFTALLLMAVASTMLTIPVMKGRLKPLL